MPCSLRRRWGVSCRSLPQPDSSLSCLSLPALGLWCTGIPVTARSVSLPANACGRTGKGRAPHMQMGHSATGLVSRRLWLSGAGTGVSGHSSSRVLGPALNVCGNGGKGGSCRDHAHGSILVMCWYAFMPAALLLPGALIALPQTPNSSLARTVDINVGTLPAFRLLVFHPIVPPQAHCLSS